MPQTRIKYKSIEPLVSGSVNPQFERGFGFIFSLAINRSATQIEQLNPILNQILKP